MALIPTGPWKRDSTYRVHPLRLKDSTYRVPLLDSKLVRLRYAWNNQALQECTMLTTNEIKKFTTSVPECNVLTYKNGYYKQTFGTAMGSPVSVVVADLVMKDEREVLPPITLPFVLEKVCR